MPLCLYLVLSRAKRPDPRDKTNTQTWSEDPEHFTKQLILHSWVAVEQDSSLQPVWLQFTKKEWKKKNISSHRLTEKNRNQNWALWGQIFPWTWLGSAWSCLGFKNSKKRPKNKFKTHASYWWLSPWLQQHPLSTFFWDTMYIFPTPINR